MNAYIFSAVFAVVALLIAALISNAVKFEGGANPKDPGKRKMVFWIFAIINPLLFWTIASFAIKINTRKGLEEWNDAIPIATIIGFFIYIILGFVLSKVFKNGKLGNWF